MSFTFPSLELGNAGASSWIPPLTSSSVGSCRNYEKQQ